MRYPVVNKATDLPMLRDWLLGLFGTQQAQFTWPQDRVPLCRVLESPDLWWVDESACELLAAALETFPDDVRNTDDDMPRPSSGLVVFEKPLLGTDAVVDGRTVEVAAVAWGPGLYRPAGDSKDVLRGTALFMFTRARPGDGLDRVEMHRGAVMAALVTAETVNPTPGGIITGDGDLFALLGRTDWIDGSMLSDDTPGNPWTHADRAQHERALQSMVEDRRLMACLWQLARTPVVHSREATFTRAERRRAQRRGGGDPQVRVLELRPHDGAVSGSGLTTGARTYSHRWVVRPHWRYQAHGAGRKERKLILVGPYVKGPDGAPLIGGQRVWKLSGGEQ